MKTKCLLYCTKGTPKTQLIDNRTINNKFELCWCLKPDREQLEKYIVNGKIVAECEVKCEEIFHNKKMFQKVDTNCFRTIKETQLTLLKHSCLTINDLQEYLKVGTFDIRENFKCGYALHISSLKVFDRPLTIEALYQFTDNNFCKKCNEYNTCVYAKSKNKPCKKVLLKAPQNMCWVWYKGERYCLISIQPQWVCKISNGEKDIEVRKKVLKGMK